MNLNLRENGFGRDTAEITWGEFNVKCLSQRRRPRSDSMDRVIWILRNNECFLKQHYKVTCTHAV